MIYEYSFLNSASECGHRSFVMMSGAFDGIDVESKFYSHEDITGVGYGIFSFYPKDKNSKRYFLDKYLTNLEKKITKDVNDSDDYARFARTVINDYVIDGSAFYDKNSVSKELIDNTGGVFVSIHNNTEGNASCLYPRLPLWLLHLRLPYSSATLGRQASSGIALSFRSCR